MSFFGKFKGANANSSAASATTNKKDVNAAPPTLLEKHLADVTGPVRADGSDKFFGFENYGSTCYCNSIIQCLYYSPHFRSHVLNFPSQEFIHNLAAKTGQPNTVPPPRAVSAVPFPNLASPARKAQVPHSPSTGVTIIRTDESKDSPENKKRSAIQNGPILEMINDHSNKYFMDESLFTSLREIFEGIINHDSRHGVVAPHRFLEILRRENEMFRSAMHQDAHEFLNLLLNQVVDSVEMLAKQHPPPESEETPKNGADDSSSVAMIPSSKIANGLDTRWVHDLFEGLLTSETRCLTCETTSQRDEAFLDLSVDLDPHTSVTACLRKFSQEEMLCERNKFHCDNCGGLQEAEKRMKIKRLPRILALHLKRFKYTEDLQRLQKLFHRVVYPFYLRLFNTTDDAEDPDRLYELYAVVVHIGGGPYHGHYVSIIKTEDRGWLLFDDELVEPVDRSYVLQFFGGELVPGAQDARQLACAYVLFYQETTMESMLKEQEMEAEKAATASSSGVAADAERIKESQLALRKEELQRNLAGAAILRDDTDHALRPVQTEPGRISAMGSPRSPFDGFFGSPLSSVMSNKHKKEAKSSEKDHGMHDVAGVTANTQKQQNETLSRVEPRSTSSRDGQMEPEANGHTVVLPEEKTGRFEPAAATERISGLGLSRFRHGSLSLRGKPKFFSSGNGSNGFPSKDKIDQSALKTLSETLPEESTTGVDAGSRNGTTLDNHVTNASIATLDNGLRRIETLHSNGHVIQSPSLTQNGNGNVEEKKLLRHRFSLGRKKSQAVNLNS